MNKVDEEYQRISNLPANRIKAEILSLMATDNYAIFAERVLPVDRCVYIYESNYRTISDFFESVKNESLSLLNDCSTDRRNDILQKAMVYIHNYLSSQYTLKCILENHGEQLPTRDNLSKALDILKGKEVCNFVHCLRNNIIHQVNFGPSLNFNSTSHGKINVSYSVSELMRSNRWKDAESYISRFDKYVLIEDVVSEFHSHMVEFLHNYENIIFQADEVILRNVLTNLLKFAKEYEENDVSGFLPVSESYISNKLFILSGLYR